MTELEEAVARYFPYAEVRPHQGEFTSTIFEAVEEGRSVLIEGSNGLGKTISALSACLPKAIDSHFKVLYVSRTHRQHERVIEELKAVSRKQPVSGISVRGRHEMCLNDIVRGNDLDARAVMEVCELLKSKNRCEYFSNIEKREDEYSDVQYQVTLHPCKASEVRRMCRRRGFCPYELVKSSLAKASVIALSYLYVFDPVIRGPFLRGLEMPLSKIILIVDEAHNLPETAVDIASSRLSLLAIRQAEIEAAKNDYKDIADFAKTVREELEKMAEKVTQEELISPGVLIDIAERKAGLADPKTFFEHMHDTGVRIRRALLNDGKYPRSFIYSTGYFLLRWMETAEDHSYVNLMSRYKPRQGAPTARLEIVALDPSKVTGPVFSQVYSSVVMSGTLQPLEAYIKITKLPEDTIAEVLPSPFPREHILPIISCGVTTAMEQRTPEMYSKIIRRIEEVAKNTPANTGIFAPSFDVLGNLLGHGLKGALDRPLFCEHRNMSSRENEKLVADFKVCSNQSGAVLLGVQGGRSSEGVDFPGDEMNSVVIVGVPYAEPTPKVKAQISYFERCFPGHGREYGYVLPAMKKASQAAGRPIRTLEDKGAMIFLDYRFATSYCQSFLPSWIRNNLRILPDQDGIVGEEISSFFRRAC